jgi:hypothetical protein
MFTNGINLHGVWLFCFAITVALYSSQNSEEEKFEVEIHIVPRMSAAVFAHLFNSIGYCTYWQDYGENFVMSMVVLYLVHIKKWATEILHLHLHSHFLNSAHL